MKLQITSLLLALSSSLFAQTTQSDWTDRSYWYVGSSFGQSSVFLGSEDIRQGFSLNLAHATPCPRLRFRKTPGQLVLEAYANRTGSTNERRSPDTYAGGLLAMARYEGRRDENGQGYYLSLGWGVQFESKRSIDLDSPTNSTPVIEVGTIFPLGQEELMIGARWLHISNAGLVGRNQGANYFLLTAGIRF